MKRCPLCGKEFENENMCPTCGIVLIDTETNSAVSTAPEKRKAFVRTKEPAAKVPEPKVSAATVERHVGNPVSGIKPVYIIVVAVVLALVIGAAAFMMRSTKAKNEAEEFYNEQSQQAETQDETDMPDVTDILEEETNEIEDAIVEPAIETVSASSITFVGASSELSESGTTHSSERVLDGAWDTAWVEGSGGQGIGERITLGFDGTYLVNGIRMAAGYQKSDYAYYNNSRPKELEIEFSDGSIEMYTLGDSFGGEQVITFDEPKETNNIKITIKSVYPGTKYEDTCISEISLF